MPRYACPICGDPNGYPIWVDAEPPEGCPHDDAWHSGKPVSIKNVSECGYQRQKAEQRARWMKECPEAFDESGNMKPGMLGHVLVTAQPPDEPVIF